MRKPIPLFLFLFLFSVSSYALTLSGETVIWSTDFNYSNAFTSNFWDQYSESCATFPDNPVYQSFGINDTFGCVGTHQRYLQETLPLVISSDGSVYKISYSFNYTHINGATGTGMSMYLRKAYNDPIDQIMVHHSLTGDNYTSVRAYADFANFGNCTTDLSVGYHEYDFILDLEDRVYYLYMDDSLICPMASIGDPVHTYNTIVLYMQKSATFEARYIDDLVVSNGSFSSASACDYPLLFCDDFDYTAPMQLSDWLIYTGAFSIDSTFTPTDDMLILRGSPYYEPYHEVEPFQMGWHISEDTVVNSGRYASQFSAEFGLNLSAGEFRYYTEDYRYSYDVYDIKAVLDGDGNYSDWYYKNSAGSYIMLCDNCTERGKEYAIKITSSWKQRDKMPFNSSFLNDSVTIFIDGVIINTTYDFIEENAQNQQKHHFVKIAGSNYTIDNYYVYVGSDKYFETLSATQVPIYEEDDTSMDGFGSTGDLATTASNIWDEMGLRSAASKTIASLLLMLFLLLIIYGEAMARNKDVNMAFVATVEFLFMIFLSYIGLLPVWILFVLVVLSSALGMFAYFRVTNQGG